MRRGLAALLAGSLVLVIAPEARAADEYRWALPEWRATFSAPRLADDRGFAVQATDDAVYVAGVTGSYDVGAGDLFLLRYDLAGNLVWHREWGGFELDQAQDLAVASDGIWVAGSGTTDENEVFAALVKFSFDGDVIAERTWRRGVVDVVQAVATDGDDVYIAGLTHPTRPDRNLVLARLSASGDPVWEVVRGAEGWDEAWDVAVHGGVVWLAGYLTASGSSTSDALVARYSPDGILLGDTVWGEAANDEARGMAVTDDAVYVTGGTQSGRTTDVFVARLNLDGTRAWQTTTGGQVTGGGGYGIAVGDNGLYVAGGSYDFPAGGDAALLRFDPDGNLTWSQVLGYPGFWDWAFDVDARDGRFYVAGVLWRPGAEWYEVLTLAYDENFPTASLGEVAAQVQDGDTAGAEESMRHFWPGDFLRWAQQTEPSTASASPGRSYVYWEGASNSGRTYGRIWADTARDPAAGQENAPEAFAGIADDMQSGNYALVRDYTGVRASLFDGLIRFRYYISHDRLIPQGGYIYVGETGIPLPPPPV